MALDKAITTQSEIDWSNYRKIRNKVNNVLKSEKHNWQRQNLKKVADDSSSTWKLVRSWLGWNSGGSPTKLCINGSVFFADPDP